jgi:hypothetical protein
MKTHTAKMLLSIITLLFYSAVVFAQYFDSAADAKTKPIYGGENSNASKQANLPYPNGDRGTFIQQPEILVSNADKSGNMQPAAGKQELVMYIRDGSPEPKQGGDTFADATVIGSLPYNDNGTTCGLYDNYDVWCTYGGSTSPDAVYSYSPPFSQTISVDLCGSNFNTKVSSVSL